MARPRKVEEPPPARRRRATTPAARERQLISLAIDVAEEQMRRGTASAQVITHYLKLASSKEDLEKEKLANENKLLKARVESLSSGQRTEELYKKALQAMRAYSGQADSLDDEID